MEGLGAVIRRVGAIAGLVTALLIGAAWAPAAAADPLSSIPFRVGADSLFEAPSVGSGAADAGTWTFARGRMVDGRLQLHVDITPARQALPAKSGPAVLFAGLELYGDGGGDMGIGMSVPSVAQSVLPDCDDDDACTYSADISFPTRELAATITRLEKDGDLMWVDAKLTLVRTFGAGTWLQVLGLHQQDGAGGLVAAGRLGAIEPTQGSLSRTGLFPASQAQPVIAGLDYDDPFDYASIAEGLRAAAGDVSSPMVTVHTDLHVRFVRGCMGWSALELHDPDGNFLVYEEALMGKALVNAATIMPVGSPWYVTVDAGEGIEHPLIQLGPIEADGSVSSVVITATMDCAMRSGTLSLVGAVGPTPSPMPSRPVPSPSRSPTPAMASSPTPGASPEPIPVDGLARPDWPLVLVAVALVAIVTLGAAGLRRRAVRS